MKILYGINSNGQGHINRSRVFIKQLQEDGHEVHVFLSGKKPPDYVYDLAPVVMVDDGIIGIYKNNQIDVWATTKYNVPKLPKFFKIARDLKKLDKTEDYDAVFSDLEPIAAIAARKMKKPLIGIDHQHAVFQPAIGIAKGRFKDKLVAWSMIHLFFPRCDYNYAIDYTDTVVKGKKVTVFPLIWKPELDNYNIRQGEHFLVYLASYPEKKLIQILSQVPEAKFFVYGFDKEEQVGNIFFKKTSREGFLEDFVSCKAIISNSGFNLTWEAVLCSKVLWAMPLDNHFEQMTNAYRLQQQNRAFITKDLSVEGFKEFFKWIETTEFKPKSKIEAFQPSDLLANAYDFINNYKQSLLYKSRRRRREWQMKIKEAAGERKRRKKRRQDGSGKSTA